MPVLWLARRTLVEIALPSRILIAELGWTLGAVATMALSGLTVLAVLAHLGYDQALLRLAVAGPVMVAVYFAIRLSTGGAELRTEILTLLRSVMPATPDHPLMDAFEPRPDRACCAAHRDPSALGHVGPGSPEQRDYMPGRIGSMN